MYYKCCVCKSTRQDAILYHFPSTEKRRIVWLEFLKRNEIDFCKLSAEQLSKLFVCQKHFVEKFITCKLRLISNAYPSLFSEDEISSGIPSQELAENVDPNHEHSYSRKIHYDHTYSRLEPLRETTASDFSELETTASVFDMSSEFDNLPEPSENSTAIQDSANENIVTAVSDPIDELPDEANVNIATAASDQMDELPDEGLNQKTKIGPRKRIVGKIKDLTPTGQIIYKELKKAKQQVELLKKAKRALKLNKKKSFENVTKNMNPYAKRIMEMQINHCTKNKKGYRFSLQDKLISLSLMKQSPEGYRFLRKLFILPSRPTLYKMVSKLDIQTGISPQAPNQVPKGNKRRSVPKVRNRRRGKLRCKNSAM